MHVIVGLRVSEKRHGVQQEVESATPPLVPLQERSRAFVPTPGQQGGRHGSLGDEEGWCLDVAHDAFWASVSTNRGWVVRQGGESANRGHVGSCAGGETEQLVVCAADSIVVPLHNS